MTEYRSPAEIGSANAKAALLRRQTFLNANRRDIARRVSEDPNRPIYSLADAKKANSDAGLFWFTPGAMYWFRGRVLEGTFTPVADGTLFVSSERNPMGHYSREYTVRFIHSGAARDRGSIDTIGIFQEYATRARAVGALKRIAAGWQGFDAWSTQRDLNR